MKIKYTFYNSSQRDIKSMLRIKTNTEGAHKTSLIKVKNMPSAQRVLFSWASSSTGILTHIGQGHISSTITPIFSFRFIYPTTFLKDTLEAPQIQGIQDGIPHPIIYVQYFLEETIYTPRKLGIIPDSSNNAFIQLVSPPYAVP